MSIETDFLRGNHRIPETRWSQILGARDHGGDPRGHLEYLIRSYWPVVYTHIRCQWNRSNEDAKDLTQEFFARFLEKDYLRSVDPRLGRFRSFLKASLEHFLRDRRDYESAAKRAGERTAVSLDFIQEIDEPSKPTSFDQEWVRRLFEISIERLQTQCDREGKRVWAELFRAFYTELPTPSYAELSRRFSLKETDVNNHLHAARVAFKEIVRRLVRDTVSTPDDLEAELQELFGDDL